MLENTGNIITPYLSEEINLKKKTPFHVQWEIFKVRSWKFLAHHPVCSQYKKHYFKIGSMYFCIGCTMIYSAILTYLLLFLIFPEVFRYNVNVIASIPFAGFGLSIIHILLKIKNKWLKAISRFSAGFGIGAYGALIIATFFLPEKWWLGFILIALLLLGNQSYGLGRGSNANRKICKICPLSEGKPPCNPEINTNIKVRKLYAIVEEEMERERNKVKNIT